MSVRFLLGPAGSGKTFRCAVETRRELERDPAGAPMLWIAPKQATYQLERQLLQGERLAGYTRLQILSFERLAALLVEELGGNPANILQEEGRLMVLRALLRRRERDLQIFRAAARQPGFAKQLSAVIREFQQHDCGWGALGRLLAQPDMPEELKRKLADVRLLLGDYQRWLEDHQLHDSDWMIEQASALLEAAAPRAEAGGVQTKRALELGAIWLDGFAELTAQQLRLLSALVPFCENVTVTMCLDQAPGQDPAWLSIWSEPARTFRRMHAALSAALGAAPEVEILKRNPDLGRFHHSPALAAIERGWAKSGPAARTEETSARPSLSGERGAVGVADVRVIRCPDPELEAAAAAREIWRFVRGGGRFREAAVIARRLDSAHQRLRRIFTRYEIPFFMDRRESIAHHPLAELTRSALRTLAFNWRLEDWLGALKSNLVPARVWEIDWLENQALAQRWEGDRWRRPLPASERDPKGIAERIRRRLVVPFEALARDLNAHDAGRNDFAASGAELARALEAFWKKLRVEQRLQRWARAEAGRGARDLKQPDAIPAWGAEAERSARHRAAWEQMRGWAANVALGFPEERLPLAEWLPIIEAGLANLTVGLIPPALDQVLISSIDRTRHPEIRLAILLGWNETIFPAPPPPPPALTDADRELLENRGLALAPGLRAQLSYERYLAYIACSRASEKLIVTFSAAAADGHPLNRSPFVDQLEKFWPELAIDEFDGARSWEECEHPSELLPAVFAAGAADHALAATARLERRHGAEGARAIGQWLQEWPAFPNYAEPARLSPEAAERLYGRRLHTSITQLENYGACPFKFFIKGGLGAQERKRFELDALWQGDFQHKLLCGFHQELAAEGKQWRDVAPEEGRARIERLAAQRLAPGGEWDGPQLTARDRLTVGILTERVRDLVAALLHWMTQYEFDPAAVEWRFGKGTDRPPFEFELDAERRLAIHGAIDRIDLRRLSGAAAQCVVVDYKSAGDKLDDWLMHNGIQLQLAAYIRVLERWERAAADFGCQRLIPAGIFYVNIRGAAEAGENRQEALADLMEAKRRAYRHTGRFQAELLEHFDNRPGVTRGDQFNFIRNRSGDLRAGAREPLPEARWRALLEETEAQIKQMAKEILGGAAALAPYRRGDTAACDHCQFHAVCRFDPVADSYRALRQPPAKRS